MNVLRRIVGRFPQQASQAKLVFNVGRYYAMRLRAAISGRAPWSQYVSDDPVQPPINDIPLGWAKGVILDRGYRTLIEIGTYNGARAIELKRLFPNADVYGLDIQDKFSTPHQRGGVTFRKFDIEFIAVPRPRLAVLAFGVLVCMTAEQLGAFLDACHRAGADIIFRELTPAVHHQGTMQRLEGTYYHDFDAVFAAHGFKMLGPRDTGQAGQFDVNFFELGYFNVATPV